MTLRRNLVLLSTVSVLAGASTGAAGSAYAYEPYHAAAFCSGGNDGSADGSSGSSALQQRFDGMFNLLTGTTASAPATVVCSVADTSRTTTTRTTDDLRVRFYDGNNGTNTTTQANVNVFCTAFELNVSGTYTTDTARCGNVSGGATTCTSNTFSGHGYIDLADVEHSEFVMAGAYCTIPVTNISSPSVLRAVQIIP
jgi:hypothetical protein